MEGVVGKRKGGTSKEGDDGLSQSLQEVKSEEGGGNKGQVNKAKPQEERGRKERQNKKQIMTLDKGGSCVTH